MKVTPEEYARLRKIWIDAWESPSNFVDTGLQAVLDALPEPLQPLPTWNDLPVAALSIGRHAYEHMRELYGQVAPGLTKQEKPISMILTCPGCGDRHIDIGEFATTKVHHTHACQSCGMCWRPAVVATVGVQFLPGFKDVSS